MLSEEFQRNETITVYVKLLDEGVRVWRPVTAKVTNEGMLLMDHERRLGAGETWEFPPGSLVEVKEHRFVGGEAGLVAISLIRAPDSL